jgi:hypothetical protein
VGRRFVHADADHRGNPVRRRDRDLEFLAWLRTATEAELRSAECAADEGPQWRRVAIGMALTRIVIDRASQRQSDPR